MFMLHNDMQMQYLAIMQLHILILVVILNGIIMDIRSIVMDNGFYNISDGISEY